MKNNILTIIAVMFLLSPQAGVLADDKGKDKNQSEKIHKIKPHKYYGSPFATKEELEAVNQAVVTTNQRIDDLEDRIIALELSDPPTTGTVVYSGLFIGGQTPDDDPLVQAWIQFRKDATGSFSSIEIKNSFNGSVKCADSAAATLIANELNEHVSVPGSIRSFTCQDKIWNVGTLVGIVGNSVELNVGSVERVNSCSADATVRPGIGNPNWGGIGITCNAPSQTLEVILTR